MWPKLPTGLSKAEMFQYYVALFYHVHSVKILTSTVIAATTYGVRIPGTVATLLTIVIMGAVICWAMSKQLTR